MGSTNLMLKKIQDNKYMIKEIMVPLNKRDERGGGKYEIMINK